MFYKHYCTFSAFSETGKFQIERSETSGFHNDKDTNHGLLGCDTVVMWQDANILEGHVASIFRISVLSI
jgi:hypothetical protein